MSPVPDSLRTHGAVNAVWMSAMSRTNKMQVKPWHLNKAWIVPMSTPNLDIMLKLWEMLAMGGLGERYRGLLLFLQLLVQ